MLLPAATPLEGARHLDDIVGFKLIAFLDVAEALDRETALEAGLHFPHVILERGRNRGETANRLSRNTRTKELRLTRPSVT